MRLALVSQLVEARAVEPSRVFIDSKTALSPEQNVVTWPEEIINTSFKFNYRADVQKINTR